MESNVSANNSLSKCGKGIKNCSIFLNVGFVTSTQIAHVVNGVLDHVLLFSGQLPFVFPVFRNLVNQSLKGQENINDNCNWNGHLHNKQLLMAKETLDQIIAVKNTVVNELKKTDISEVVIALGATIFTIKEAIVIKLPNPDRNHFCINHENSTIKIIMHLMRTLATSSELTESSSLSGKPIKTFVLLKKPTNDNVDKLLEPFPGFQLPSKCRTTYLTVQLQADALLQSNSTQMYNCCTLMQICNDIEEIGFQESSSTKMEVDCLKINKDWFLCSSTIKGFKDTEIRGKSVFN